MTADANTTLADVRLHPALIVMGGFLTATIGRDEWVLESDATGWRLIGLGLVAVGLLSLVLAYWAMARARTPIDPRQATKSLVTSGIFRVSRNPIYLGWFLLALGVGIASRSLFSVAAAFLMVGLLQWAVVVHEEAYLERAFGDEFRRYRERTRRWI